MTTVDMRKQLQAAATVMAEQQAEIERLRETVDDLTAKIIWMIDVSYAWDADGCFTFPDGEGWMKRD